MDSDDAPPPSPHVTPALTVIIPARNEANVIAEQLDALAAQETDEPWALVVVDNGSDDGTADVARSYADRIGQLDVIAETTPGLCAARAAGAAAAVSELIAFCDADDVVCPTWVDSMISGLRSADIVTGPHDVDRLNDAALASMRGIGRSASAPTFHGLFPTAHGNNFGIHRELFQRMGGFDERFIGGEDVEFCMRASWDGRDVGFAPGALVHYRFRTTPAQLWRQGYGYGKARPRLRKALLAHGAAAPRPLAGWKSWVWLVRILPTAVSAPGRCHVAWVAGNRLGQAVGSVEARCLFV